MVEGEIEETIDALLEERRTLVPPAAFAEQTNPLD